MPIKTRIDKRLFSNRDQFAKLVNDTPRLIGNKAVEHYKSSFKNAGFRDDNFKPWQKRNPVSVRNKGRALLIDTGRLRRSIRIIVMRKNFVRVGSIGVPYAAIHNDGFSGIQSVKSHMRTRKYKGQTNRHKVNSHKKRVNMPQRQFIGESKFLNRYIEVIIANKIKRIFK